MKWLVNRFSIRGLKRLSSACVVLCAFSVATLASANDEAIPLSQDDFAVGRLLHAGEQGELQSVLLDFDVYTQSIEPGLADVRVFDAEGRLVPYALRRRLAREGKKTTSLFTKVPLFRLGGDRSSSPAATAGDFEIKAELSDKGAVVRVLRGDGVEVRSGQATAWLVDATRLKRALIAIEFMFVDGTEDFMSGIRVEASDDLSKWRGVGAGIVVARLDQSGQQIERMRFDLPATRAKYLRLTPESGASLPELARIHVRQSLITNGPELPMERFVVSGEVNADSPETVLFDLKGAPSIQSVRVVLPNLGSLIEGRVESSLSLEGPWTRHGTAVIYYTERDNVPVRSRAIDWRGRRHRYVRFAASQRGGGLQGGIPELEVKWVPDQLLYLDRGLGPSTLAIGRLGAKDESFTPDQLLRTLHGTGEGLRESTARLGETRVLAGASALEPPPEPVPWRTYGLWALLVGIVGIVLGLGFRLMRAADGNTKTPN